MEQTFLDDLIGLIRIPSVYDKKTKSSEAPYGQAVAQALEYMKSLALRDGFDVLEYQGHALAICYGTQAERIDVVSHLDVVEVMDEWDVPAFEGRIVDERLYGRGTQDMKSAVMLTYYALKEIKARGLKLNKQLRVVLGTDEERTMKDIEYYISQAGQPRFAFTPDGAFPVLLAEKGALMWTLHDQFDTQDFSLSGGAQCNVVAPNCHMVLDQDLYTKTQHFIQILKLEAKLTQKDTHCLVDVVGKAAHASQPDLGRNALVDGLNLLRHLFPNHEPLQTLYHVFSDSYGHAAKLAIEDDILGKLTLNLGTLSLQDGYIKALIDVRYPSQTSGEALTKIMREQLKGIQISLDYNAPAVLIDTNSPYVQACLNAYRKHTLDELSQPYVSGGVTYCKVIDRCTAFGIHFPHQVSLAHQKNEYIELSDLDKAYPILRDAMIAMAQVEEA
jgi:succinyl-diaminopimelate desuccinylase